MRITKLQKLIEMKERIVKLSADIDELINWQRARKAVEHNRYEQRIARGQCTATASCKTKPVPCHTLCAFHLHKASAASNRRRLRRIQNA